MKVVVVGSDWRARHCHDHPEVFGSSPQSRGQFDLSAGGDKRGNVFERPDTLGPFAQIPPQLQTSSVQSQRLVAIACEPRQSRQAAERLRNPIPGTQLLADGQSFDVK